MIGPEKISEQRLACFRLSLAAVASIVVGCASLQPAGSKASNAVAPAAFLADLVTPKVDQANSRPPQLDLSLFDPDRYRPSNERDWIEEQRVLAYADIDGDLVRVRHVRNAEF